jgi:hypothetical protein
MLLVDFDKVPNIRIGPKSSHKPHHTYGPLFASETKPWSLTLSIVYTSWGHQCKKLHVNQLEVMTQSLVYTCMAAGSNEHVYSNMSN